MLHCYDAVQICSATNNYYSFFFNKRNVSTFCLKWKMIFLNTDCETRGTKSPTCRAFFYKMPSMLQGKKSLIKVHCSLLLFFLLDTTSTQCSCSDVPPAFSGFSEAKFVTGEQVWRLLTIRQGITIVPAIRNIMASFRAWGCCSETALSVPWPIATCGSGHTFKKIFHASWWNQIIILRTEAHAELFWINLSLSSTHLSPKAYCQEK